MKKFTVSIDSFFIIFLPPPSLFQTRLLCEFGVIIWRGETRWAEFSIKMHFSQLIHGLYLPTVFPYVMRVFIPNLGREGWLSDKNFSRKKDPQHLFLTPVINFIIVEKF